MGGKEGAWGYLAQAVVCVINSLMEKDWIYVQMEPDTQNDKVDIAWFYEDCEPEVVQVKTSIRNFPLPDIRRWLETLIQDEQSASQYSLILLGTCNNDTKDAINRINKNKATDEDWANSTLLKSYGEKIEINLRTNDQDALESQIYRYLGKYLHSKGKHTTDTVLELMSKALGYTYMLLSTQGKKESRGSFEKRLLDWVNTFLGVTESRKSDIKVEFYLRDRIPFSTTMTVLSTTSVRSKHIVERKRELILLYEEIKAMVIPKKEHEESKQVSFSFFEREMKKLSYQTSSELGGKRREELEGFARELLGIELDDEFFYVGNLKEPVVQPRDIFGLSSVERTGTEEEKFKHQLQLKFEKDLESLQAILTMFSFLDSFKIIPLVLRNVGTKQDEQIKVRIHLPNDVMLLTPRNVLQPDINVIKEFTGFNGYINKVLSHRKDSQINSYTHRPYKLYNIPSPILGYKEEQLIDEFYTYLQVLFDFEVYKEEDKQILVFEFPQLSPKENLAFPCFLLVKTDRVFELDYQITSVNLPDVEKGILKYQF